MHRKVLEASARSLSSADRSSSQPMSETHERERMCLFRSSVKDLQTHAVLSSSCLHWLRKKSTREDNDCKSAFA